MVKREESRVKVIDGTLYFGGLKALALTNESLATLKQLNKNGMLIRGEDLSWTTFDTCEIDDLLPLVDQGYFIYYSLINNLLPISYMTSICNTYLGLNKNTLWRTPVVKVPADKGIKFNALVKVIALENGFSLKEQSDGSRDLNPYVYTFAEKLLERFI